MVKVRRASDNEFWIAIQRLWTFEEPSSRWIRLRKNLAKIAPNSMSQDSASISKQEDFFHAVYGVPPDFSRAQNELNVYLSITFAGAEIEKFQDAAFAFCAQGDFDVEYEQLLAEIACARNFSLSQKSYLRHRARITPEWTRLLDDGPWSGDSRVEFVRDILATAATLFTGTSDPALMQRFQRFEGNFKQREKTARATLPSSFLPRRIILVEGATEQILLPHFAKCISEKWNEKVILVIPAGGANQVARRYPSLRELTTLPIDCLLDGDVLSQAESLRNEMKRGDKLYILRSGAIEEAFPREQIIELANSYFDGLGGEAIYAPVSLQDLTSATNQESLDRLWRKRNRGSFDKIGFAKVVAEKITKPSEIPGEIRQLIVELCSP